jgi:hypothetical protein
VTLPDIFDGTEEDQRERGMEAASILGNTVFRMAEEGARASIRAEWESETDPTKRDALWHKAKALDVLRRELEAIRDNGGHSGQRLVLFRKNDA